MSDEARLIRQLRELLALFAAHDIRHALIGGLAVNIHGYSRATHDVDFLIDSGDENALHAAISCLGYGTVDRREDLSSYARGGERADFLHAHRADSRRLLAEATRVQYGELEIPVVSPEGLLGFKIQAYSDDPRRLQDVVDMLELVRARGQGLNWDEVQGYFTLFGQEDLFDELKRAAGAHRD